MAKLKGPLAFTGKLQGLSAFTREGTNGVILRPRYGPSKTDIETKPAFANTRKNNKEFGGRSTASKCIRDGYHTLKPISDATNLSRLNKLLKTIQEMDTLNEYGKRSVALSLKGELLEGFPLNQFHPFESVLQNPVEYSMSRDKLMAVVTLPALLPGVNFIPPTSHPYFRIAATLNIVPDFYYHQVKYRPKVSYESIHPQLVNSEWMAAHTRTEAVTLQLNMPVPPPNEEFSLVLTLGIEMGTATSTTHIQTVKYAGSGKILAVR
jgi:hypothetical protein